ncbi:TIR domain-containing protein [Photobacterium leiognathi]|uniref:TIR domain-containing protein n=1 Tax=Photobacterium leiognathi TaxID=553611 RepID=UPI002981468E|nr:TIR domain-containing protein [Photobacterium leiognathi]
MGRKIFVSYKYADTNVKDLPSVLFRKTKVRDYVTVLQEKLDIGDHINKGEADDENLSHFKDSTIESHLRNKIFDSSITIIMISPNMKSFHEPESEQWIPWEISYSLRNTSKANSTSKPNALLAVVLPDINGSYDYFVRDNICTKCDCRTIFTDNVFDIIKKNMFNIKQATFSSCSNHSENTVYIGEFSYIKDVKWCDFIDNINLYLDAAVNISENINNYVITKKLNPKGLII